MYQIGECVLYGAHGVCRVAAVEERSVDRKIVQYYVLEPMEQGGSKYLIPTHNQAAVSKLRPVISREDLVKLLRSEEVRRDDWIADENRRKQYYRELLSGGDRAALLRMIGTLHRHKQAQTVAGRKFHLCDDNFLREAQKLLNSEFSMVLGIERSAVGDYVIQALSAPAE